MTLKINGATGGSVSIDAPDNTSPAGTDVTLTLPTSAGSSGQVLTTDGSGTLSFTTLASDSITEGNTTVECVDTGSNGHIKFNTEGSEKVRIDANGNMAINLAPSTSSVSGSTLEVRNAGSGIVATSAADTSFTNNSYYNNAWKYGGSHAAGRLQLSDGNLNFFSAGSGTTGNTITFTRRMVLSQAGTFGLGFGIDNVPWSGNAINDYNGFRFTNATSGGSIAVGMNCNNETVCVMHRTNGTGRMLEFKYNNSVIGYVNGGSSSVSYNTSSDYRLKENVVNLDNAITRVKQLLPRRFNWISDESNTLIDGFIAHEAASVVPEAVTGEHNEVEVWKEGQELPDGVAVGDTKLDEDGNTIPVYQGIDQSKLVPLLTAALQEAIAKIETLETANASLEARLTALEGGAS
jgi:hypothetical protein